MRELPAEAPSSDDDSTSVINILLTIVAIGFGCCGLFAFFAPWLFAAGSPAIGSDYECKATAQGFDPVWLLGGFLSATILCLTYIALVTAWSSEPRYRPPIALMAVCIVGIAISVVFVDREDYSCVAMRNGLSSFTMSAN